MKRIFSCGLALAVLAVLSLPAFAADEGSTVSVKGEVLDLACYLASGASGEGHAKCAQACVKGGQPMGLLDDEGNVWVLYASHEDGAAFDETKNFAGKKVEIDGVAGKRAGLNGLEVHAVKAL